MLKILHSVIVSVWLLVIQRDNNYIPLSTIGGEGRGRPIKKVVPPG